MNAAVLKRWALGASRSLALVPGLIVFGFAALGIALVEIDGELDLEGSSVVFAGDGDAARTVLSVMAGSLITVAGLTFSITILVLQMASTQFSPRILRTFFGDRLTQVTIGAFVGTFVYSILVLRSVGTFADETFVPRLSVTFATAAGVAAVILLIVYLHHVSLLVQVSHVSARIARQTLARIDALMPDPFDPEAEGKGIRALDALSGWEAQPSRAVLPGRPGFVNRVDDLGRALEEAGERRVAILVRPGDFVSLETPIARIWPAAEDRQLEQAVRDSVAIASERDLGADVDFGLRQLADTALRAISPGVNDPVTAVTCIGYIRSILARIAARSDPPATVTEAGGGILVAAGRHYSDYLAALEQLGRHVREDAWVATEILDALLSVATVAADHGARRRLDAIGETTAHIAEHALAGASSRRDAARIEERVKELERLRGQG